MIAMVGDASCKSHVRGLKRRSDGFVVVRRDLDGREWTVTVAQYEKQRYKPSIDSLPLEVVSDDEPLP